jgi:hypothetical protein
VVDADGVHLIRASRNVANVGENDGTAMRRLCV